MVNKVTYEISDDDLMEVIKSDLSNIKNEFSTLESIMKKSEGYFNGPGQIDRSKLKKGDAELFVNRIFVSIETMASIVTSTTPPPWVSVSPNKRGGKRLQSKLERRFRDLWEVDLKGQKKSEACLRNHYMGRFATARYYNLDRKDGLGYKGIRVEDIRFDTDVMDIQESSFVAERIKKTTEEMCVAYPDFADKLFNGPARKKVEFWRHWLKYYDKNNNRKIMYVDHYNGQILVKKKNPFWREGGKNHFGEQNFPYILLNSIQDNKSLIDSTSATENAIPLQDALNSRKRQIHRNAWMANGLIVALGRALKKKQFDQIDASTDKISLEGDVARVSDAFTKMTGRSLESGIYEDMYDTKREIDNIYGAHETTRGERGGNETAKGRALLRDADFGRQDMTSRAFEQFSEDLYNGWLQIMYVKGGKSEALITPAEPDSPEEQLKMTEGLVSADTDILNANDLQKYTIKVIVKKGTTRPKDPESMRDMALTLKQTGNMNPVTFFELIGLENPRKHARREFLWNTDPASLFSELGGPDLVDSDAIAHIIDIIAGVAGSEDVMLETDDIEKMSKHVQTNTMYLKSMEVDEDVPVFDDLDSDIQGKIEDHAELELEVLEKMLMDEQAEMAKQGIGQDMPMPQEMGMEQGMTPDGGMAM